MTRTKAFIRAKLWFPGLNTWVENFIKEYARCQLSYAPSEIGTIENVGVARWSTEKCKGRFLWALSSGDYLLVITDECSRYPVAEYVKSVKASMVILVIDKIMSDFGIVECFKSDNGSPFDSHAFAYFAIQTGFKHRKITPQVLSG